MLNDTRPANIVFAHNQVDDFLDFANSFKQGYCKHWKAVGILVMVAEMPDEMRGLRLLSYVENCLKMEGFDDMGCALVAEWIELRFESLRTVK
jgi:hypothetical protein